MLPNGKIRPERVKKVPLDKTIDIILDKLYGKKHTCIFSNEPRDTWCKSCTQLRLNRPLLEKIY